ncbi:MAG: Smr/MutS family protein [Alphaproteobacteria bacterium]|nr:Smr/MutS family protein [Alphaproteobacteria bacterium]
MRRPPRGLSAEERALWQHVAESVRAIARNRASAIETTEAATKPPPPAPPAPAAPPRAARAPAPPPPSAPARPAAPPELSPESRPGGVDNARWQALARGSLRPERRLDLHHQRAAHAHALVERFIPDSVAEGCRCVEIVTGRGAGAEGGVLRRELPHWLNAPALRRHILAIVHAPGGAAGPNTGALRLLLRRAGGKGQDDKNRGRKR